MRRRRASAMLIMAASGVVLRHTAVVVHRAKVYLPKRVPLRPFEKACPDLSADWQTIARRPTCGILIHVNSNPISTALRRWWNTLEASEFVDYYEILEISPNADSGAIERMFRYLAQRYHPDNRDTVTPPIGFCYFRSIKML
jgi:preprotein translocase subunit Sec63